VGNSRPVHTDVVDIAEVEDFLPRELSVIVSDDRVGYAEAIDDVDEERDCLLEADVNNGSGLDPLRELVDRYENVVKPLGACRSGPTMSRFQTMKGHVMGIVCNACARR
jgi:hypothetical protein